MAAQLVHRTISYADLGVQWAKLRTLHNTFDFSSIVPSDVQNVVNSPMKLSVICLRALLHSTMLLLSYSGVLD
jgi:hypothetical protein